MSNIAPISTTTWKVSQEQKLLKLRDVLTVGLYLVESKISGIFSTEVKRMGNAFHDLEGDMKTKKIITEEKGLEAKWKEHMNKVWDDSKTQLTDFMDAKVKELKKDLGCTFDVSIKGKGTVSTPEPDDAPAKVADDKCKALEFIHDNWVKHVKDNIGTRPWDSAGAKRPAVTSPQVSTDDLHDNKKGKGAAKKPGSQ
jgi:hypothetical protein